MELINFEERKRKRAIEKISSYAILVRIEDKDLEFLEIYKKAGVKSKSEVMRFLIDSHEILRILLRNSDSNLYLTNQDQWTAEDRITFYNYLGQFKAFEDKLNDYKKLNQK